MVSSCCLVKFDHEGTATGSFKEVGGLDSYVVGEEFGSEKVLVFATDIYGYKLSNTHLVADQLSELLNIKVIVPDILSGEPLEDVSKIQEWLVRHSIEITQKIFDGFLTKVRQEAKIVYGIGFCFGAPEVVANLKEGGLLDAGCISHPSFMTVEQFEGVTKPLLISVGLEDYIFGADLRTKSIEKLEAGGSPFEVGIFKGAPHGYQIKGDLSVPSVKYAKEKTTISQALFLQQY